MLTLIMLVPRISRSSVCILRDLLVEVIDWISCRLNYLLAVRIEIWKKADTFFFESFSDGPCVTGTRLGISSMITDPEGCTERVESRRGLS